MKIFKHYYEAVMHCVDKDIQEYRVKKHNSRPNTTFNWYIIDKKGKAIKK